MIGKASTINTPMPDNDRPRAQTVRHIDQWQCGPFRLAGKNGWPKIGFEEEFKKDPETFRQQYLQEPFPDMDHDFTYDQKTGERVYDASKQKTTPECDDESCSY